MQERLHQTNAFGAPANVLTYPNALPADCLVSIRVLKPMSNPNDTSNKCNHTNIVDNDEKQKEKKNE